MARDLGIKKTHELMKTRLADYITSQYFGENQLLLDSADELLAKEGNLYQKPYIESAPSYIKIENGISNCNIKSNAKLVFEEFVNKKLGVFKTPFKHQIQSLENFANGRNLFVATGTGSGKTECFMWPILYKLVDEILNSKQSWNQRGVRAMLIYPMNALVSDQIARLRSIIGDEGGEFINILHRHAGETRRPQFGMYTGRTQYPGNRLSKSTNLKIAESYEKSYLVQDDLTEDEKREKQKDIDGLKKINKYPAKNMKAFVDALKSDELAKYDSSNDAELMLRYEMQQHTPDILITNYSMLEYMLIRKVENNIWGETKKWLSESADNKLLIVIDEAHMYSGASGGEVALLIRRLFSRLGIDSKKVQFIMTSASMPNESEEDKLYIKNFAANLSGCSSNSFEYLFGEKEELIVKNNIPFDIHKLANLNLDLSSLTDDKIEKNIKIFASSIFNENIDGDSRKWLFDNITRYKPFVDLFNICRGNAVSYNELLKNVIGVENEEGEKALENLLLLAPLAKDENNNVLFPARIHLFFRGLNGIYACLNPNCNNSHEGDNIHLGSLFTRDISQCPHCHSKVYELINDRRCGALFIKTYIHRNQIYSGEINCWNKKGIDDEHDMVEFPLFIVPKEYNFEEKPKDTEVAYFDFKSGKLYPTNINEDTCIKVLKSTVLEDNAVTFKKCPKCGRSFRFLNLSDFRVKGNFPFYNIIKAQFDAQPMTKEPNKYIPNGGKKVLLFSDSRQSAAILARDMTKIADLDSFRRAIYLAMRKVYSHCNDNEYPMSCLYPAFLEVSLEKKLRFFYGKDLDVFESDKLKVARAIGRCHKLKRQLNYDQLRRDINSPCGMYQSDLIEMFCNPTINFHNLGIGYIAPIDDKLLDALDEINIPSLGAEEFQQIFIAFLCNSFTDSFSFDNLTSDEARREVKYIRSGRYGFTKKESKAYYNKKIMEKYPDGYERIYDAIVENFYRLSGETYFLNLETVKVVLTGDDKLWVRCGNCGQIHPFAIDGCCSICGSPHIYFQKPADLKQIDYWRKPLFSKEDVKSLNTEEHTAQLSFKDQKIETWAKTEDYEMRFQDINVEKENTAPIDILSCTTTMEVGIDIGSLTAVGLRNVPPLRENYQQRAGRAGRRGSSLSTISTYAQGGPHDTYYFNKPEKIIRGKPRRPWIDIKNEKIIGRHFNLIALTRFFENRKESLHDIKTGKFKEIYSDFIKYIGKLSFNETEIRTLFIDADIDLLKDKLIFDLDNLLSNFDGNEDSELFADLFEKGILPTYSFPLDVVEFNIEDPITGETKLSPQRSIDIAINEYAPGRSIVVDKKTYKSAGIYTPTRRKDINNFYKPAEPYFKEENGYFCDIYMCSNPLCGWFGKVAPKNDLCPFCGQPIGEENKRHMLKPWGFAPLNARDMPETEVDSELSYADEPCYSATPSNDLTVTKYENLKVCNRKNEEIIILNKGIDSQGFDVCKDCGAAQLHGDKSLRENNVGAPFTNKGQRVSCSHKLVEEGLYLGTNFRTDMFFMQIYIDNSKITDDNIILKVAAVTLCEALKLSASRILDIEYNDLTIGNRTRSDGHSKYIDIFFYDTLSSGAGYSTQIEPNLDDIFEDTLEILSNGDVQDICNFWNQRVQKYFNKKLAKDLLLWIMQSKLPDDFTEQETNNLCVPLVNIIKNEEKIDCTISNNIITIGGNSYVVTPAFKKCFNNSITDFEIAQSLPVLLERIVGGF